MDIGKRNQITALRFQTGGVIRHPWPPVGVYQVQICHQITNRRLAHTSTHHTIVNRTKSEQSITSTSHLQTHLTTVFTENHLCKYQDVVHSAHWGYTPNSKHWFTTSFLTIAVFSYAIGSRKLSANEQFFCWCSNSSKFVTNNSNKTRHVIYSRQQSLHQHE